MNVLCHSEPHGRAFQARLLPIILILFLFGCHAPSPQEGYAVMFDSMPQLSRDQITHKGQTVGHIVSSVRGGDQGARLVVFLDDHFLKKNGYSFVLYVKNRGLEVEKVRSFGALVTKDDRFRGFASRSALNWFKLRTLVRNRTSVAKKEADYLHHRFSAAEKRV